MDEMLTMVEHLENPHKALTFVKLKDPLCYNWVKKQLQILTQPLNQQWNGHEGVVEGLEEIDFTVPEFDPNSV
jgi:hypothetical protein